jgi:hypothetical protein
VKIKLRAKYRNARVKTQYGRERGAPKKSRRKTGVINHRVRVMRMTGSGHKRMEG